MTNRKCIYLRCIRWWLDIHVQFEMIATIKLINTHTQLPFFFFFFGLSVVRILKIYYLSKLQVYNSVLLTTIMFLHIRCLETIHLPAESLYPLTKPPHSPNSSPRSHFTLPFSECHTMGGTLTTNLQMFTKIIQLVGVPLARKHDYCILWNFWIFPLKVWNDVCFSFKQVILICDLTKGIKLVRTFYLK